MEQAMKLSEAFRRVHGADHVRMCPVAKSPALSVLGSQAAASWVKSPALSVLASQAVTNWAKLFPGFDEIYKQALAVVETCPIEIDGAGSAELRPPDKHAVEQSLAWVRHHNQELALLIAVLTLLVAIMAWLYPRSSAPDPAQIDQVVRTMLRECANRGVHSSSGPRHPSDRASEPPANEVVGGKDSTHPMRGRQSGDVPVSDRDAQRFPVRSDIPHADRPSGSAG